MTQVGGEHLRGQAQLELWLGALEQGQPWQDAELRKCGGRQDREFLFPCVAAETVEGARDLLERFRRDKKEGFAFFSERDRAMQPMKQLQLHGVFQKPDLPADGSLCDAEFVRCEREALEPRNGFKVDQCV